MRYLFQRLLSQGGADGVVRLNTVVSISTVRTSSLFNTCNSIINTSISHNVQTSSSTSDSTHVNITSNNYITNTSNFKHGQQVRFQRYRPFTKPIRGPLRIAMRGNRKDAIIQETLEKAQLAKAEQALKENQKREGIKPGMLTPQEKMLANTPFQGVRYVHAFHPEYRLGIQDIYLKTKLDIDLSREAVRGVCQLPNGLQTKTKLLVFCKESEVQDMLDAGADIAGLSDMIKKIQQGWTGFDRCIASHDVMRDVLKVARILGPKRLMPSPKSGTVVDDLKAAIREIKGGGQLEYRAEGEGHVLVTIGDTSFTSAKILENMKSFYGHLLKTKQKGGSSSSGANNMIKDARTGSSDKKQNNYFLSCEMWAGEGPHVLLEPEAVLPQSVGYFR